MVQQKGKYMYCIIETRQPETFGPLGIGGQGQGSELFTVNHRDIAAVVSHSAQMEYVVTRDNSLAHEKAIEAVMTRHEAVLPVSYSTVAESEEEIVEKVLKPRYKEFKDLLAWIRGKMELGLKARWVEMPPVFQALVEENEEIKAFKERVTSQPYEAAYYDQVKIGQMVQEALKAKKEREEGGILKALSPLTCNVKRHEPYGDAMFASFSFLIERENGRAFDEALGVLRDNYGSNVKFDYVTDAPSFNFVTVFIRWDREEEASASVTQKPAEEKTKIGRPKKGRKKTHVSH
mgnify:FL=1